MVNAPRIEQFFCSNGTPRRSPSSGPIKFWPPSPRVTERIAIVERSVCPKRHEICVFIIWMRRNVKNTTKHVELLQCELYLASIHLLGR